MSKAADRGLDYKVGRVASETGPNKAMVVILKVKPGHEEQIKADIEKFGPLLDKYGQPAKLGLHESKITTFDNNTRCFFITTFDPDVDPYLDDAILRLWTAIHLWARHCEGYPGTMDTAPSDPAKLKEWWAANDPNKIKAWWMTCWNKCHVFYRPYARTFQEIVKALKVNDAFQKVLDDPKAGKALQDPALKPLLELAAD